MKILYLDPTVSNRKRDHQQDQHQLLHHPFLVNGEHEVWEAIGHKKKYANGVDQNDGVFFDEDAVAKPQGAGQQPARERQRARLESRDV